MAGSTQAARVQRVQKVQKVQRGRLTALRAEGCVEGLHRFAQGGDSGFAAEGGGLPLRAILIKSALRDWLYGSYGMIRMLVIGSLRSPPKGETAEWYMKYMTLCFSSPYFSFPLEVARELDS